MTPVVDKLNGHGLINTARRERLPKKTKVPNAVLAMKGLPGSTDTLESFTYKGEWVSV